MRRADPKGAPMSPALMTYGALVVAIALEVIATTFLKQSQQFTRLWPTIGMAVFYAASFYFLSVALKTLPVGIAYAIWSGLGVVLIALMGAVVLGEVLDIWAILGMALIVAGVAVINVMSSSAPH
jgi:small multidrug resistance pump